MDRQRVRDASYISLQKLMLLSSGGLVVLTTVTNVILIIRIHAIYNRNRKGTYGAFHFAL